MGKIKYTFKFNPLTGQLDKVWSGKTISDDGTVWQWDTTDLGAWVSTAVTPSASSNLLLESGSYFLLESGDKLILG